LYKNEFELTRERIYKMDSLMLGYEEFDIYSLSCIGIPTHYPNYHKVVGNLTISPYLTYKLEKF